MKPINWARHTAKALLEALFSSPLGTLLRCLAELIVHSLPLVMVVSFFSGAALMTQASYSLRVIGNNTPAGYIVGLGGIRDFFPIIAACCVSCQAAAQIATKLATWSLTGQIEAIRVMGLNLYQFLIAPRVLACVIGTPVLVIVANITGLYAAHLVGVLQLQIDSGTLWGALTQWISIADVALGCLKGMAFGLIIGLVSTYEGLRAGSGASEVGLLARRAIVRSSIASCMASLLMSLWIYA